MAKDFGAKYNGDDVVITVGESILCKRDTGHVYFDVPAADIRLVAPISKNEFKINWLDGRKMINVTVKSKHSARIVEDVKQAAVEANE